MLGLIKINILDTLTHLFPSNGGVSEPSINSVIQEITESPIVKNVVETASKTEDKFFSLRNIYSKYINSWFANNTSDSTSYSIFDSWYFWIGLGVVIVGIGAYFYFRSSIGHTEQDANAAPDLGPGPDHPNLPGAVIPRPNSNLIQPMWRDLYQRLSNMERPRPRTVILK